jgi:mycoredoxin
LWRDPETFQPPPTDRTRPHHLPWVRWSWTSSTEPAGSGQLTKLAYAIGQLAAGSAAAAQRKANSARKVRGQGIGNLLNPAQVITAQLPPAGASLPGQLTMYSVPWCGFCRNLKSQLARAGIAISEVDIEHDPAGADYVMSVNGGKPTVPTVLLPDGTALVNPLSAAQIRARLAAVTLS